MRPRPNLCKHGLISLCVSCHPPYGGVAREARIGPDADAMCDKAWHMDAGEPRQASVVLACGFCGRRYARCAACDASGSDSARASMTGHLSLCRYRVRTTRAKVNF